uniref:RRM domain-containing protein n=1 Tax=Homalodisca liturata TaxID=320908 RepID=A0A1B6HVD8_9HEMI
MKINSNKNEMSIKNKNKELHFNSVSEPNRGDGIVSKKKKHLIEKNKGYNKALKKQKGNYFEILKSDSVKEFSSKKKKRSFLNHIEEESNNLPMEQETTETDSSNKVCNKKKSVNPNEGMTLVESNKVEQEQSFKTEKFRPSNVQSHTVVCELNINDNKESKKSNKLKTKEASLKYHHTKLNKFQQNNEISDESTTLEKCKENTLMTNKNKHESTEDEYRPGMLSEMLQKKKFGHLIIPWDPSFGMDTSYVIPKSDEGENTNTPELKINPLFDLSKRRNECSAEESTGHTQSIFVGNLPTDITIGTIKKLFRKFGLVLKVKLRSQGSDKEKTGMNASVKFSTLESCKAALELNGKLYKGHHLRVSLSNEKVNSNKENGVFVGNLAFKAKDDDLWNAFQDCGEIESVRIIRDVRSGIGKGYGYVNFKFTDSVDRALSLHGSLLLNRNLRVSKISSNTRSISDLDKVKRRKKKLASGSKARSRKYKDQSKSDGEKNSQQSETEEIVVKKVKKKTVER